MIKKITSVILTVLALSFTAVAGNDNSRFTANELSILLKSSYSGVGQYNGNANAGASFFITRNLGIEGDVQVFNEKGTSIDRVNLGGVLRYPIGFVAPYGRLGTSWNWQSDKFGGYASIGLEARPFNNRWGVFIQGDYAVSEVDSLNSVKNGDFGVSGGIRLVLF